jgi:polyphosphate kinase
MFLVTHTPQAPWTVVNANDKRTARSNAIRFVLSELPYADKDAGVAKQPDPEVVGSPLDVWPEFEALS